MRGIPPSPGPLKLAGEMAGHQKKKKKKKWFPGVSGLGKQGNGNFLEARLKAGQKPERQGRSHRWKELRVSGLEGKP